MGQYTSAGANYDDILKAYGINAPSAQSGIPQRTSANTGVAPSNAGGLFDTGFTGQNTAAGSAFGPYGAAIGAGLDLFQAFKNNSNADEKNAVAQQQYQDELDALRKQEERQKMLDSIANAYTGANYASQAQDSILGKYNAYNKQIGR